MEWQALAIVLDTSHLVKGCAVFLLLTEPHARTFLGLISLIARLGAEGPETLLPDNLHWKGDLAILDIRTDADTDTYA